MSTQNQRMKPGVAVERVIEPPEVSVLDKVLEETAERHEKQTPPAGYKALAAGSVKKIRVNKTYIDNPGDTEPFIVEMNGIESYYEEVIMPSICRMVANKTEVGYGCGRRDQGKAWVETDQEVWVK